MAFVVEQFGVDLDPWQLEALQALGDPDKQRIAMKACKGPGKTALLAWTIWWFLVCQADKGAHPKGAATSITGDNLADNLWPELAKWQQRSEFLQTAFVWTKTRIFAKDHPETWFFSARSWSKSADSTRQADTLAGLHSDYLMFVLDESGGMPDSVMAAAEGGLSTGKWAKIIQAGNPTNLDGPLYRACTRDRNLWSVIEITGDPDDPKRSSRISAKWAREQIAIHGADNPWVLTNVFGKFPPSSINALIGPDDITEAMGRTYRGDSYAHAAKILGVDVARFGDDRTVLFPRQGLNASRPVSMRGMRTQEIVARIAIAVNRWQPDAIMVDDTGGYGAGVIDGCLQAGMVVMGIPFSGRATDPRYYNKRAEMYFRASEWVKKSKGALPPVAELVREASAATYAIKGDKLIIEDKGQIKDRLGYSPDLWDAFCLTFAQDVMPRFIAPGIARRSNRAITERREEGEDYDAYADARL